MHHQTNDNYMDDNSSDCWASDAASRNGKYYFYFSDRKRGIGVMSANSPAGPFKDALGKPLVAPMHDPTIFIDKDRQQTPYLIYGDKAGGGFHIAKLNEDMISLAETPQVIQINGKEWENAPEWMDKNYLFKRGDTYYLSWGRDYAVSKNIYGPYQCAGAVGNGHHLNEFAHGSFFEWKGQFYHIWCYYLQPGFKYRASIISYCHFDDEGRIVTDTDFLDAHFANGVGQYHASWNKIEAEWYSEISGKIHKQGSREKGFVLTGMKHNDWVKFAHVTFDKACTLFTAKLSTNRNEGILEIRSDSPSGSILGSLNIAPGQAKQQVECRIKECVGTKNIYLVFKGDNCSNWQLDWLQFK